ncbi:SMC-Scp complex subunit ScpB [Komagataeibacter medellinensis]|uniref:SMC-Scp complex subunit ScpB n=1 Tax=Komagataeibacter medellinensis TaxID=1177712 RepID=A0ABQ6VTF5_9PROT|nr:SMC-Scp complex subunit ScpB [Komagataeibacter medellinensis]KAB8123470.1 SMC-Scp complex subunit ScpB [Komagataeibacter medellinensis]
MTDERQPDLLPDDMPAPITVRAFSLRLVEALVFARADPLSTRAIAEVLTAQGGIPHDVMDRDAYVAATLAALGAQYEGGGVVLVEVAGGWQFRTAPDLAPRLTRVMPRPRRLARSTMETLAIIAYHQPCTRAEIEEIRGVSLSQQVLDTLLEAELILPLGRKEVPGRPILWGTSAGFLRHFGLKDLGDLPRREELLVDVPDSPAPVGMPEADTRAAEAPDGPGMLDSDMPDEDAHGEVPDPPAS